MTGSVATVGFFSIIVIEAEVRNLLEKALSVIMDFSHPRERKASSYGFIPDIIAYFGSDSEPGYDIPSETSNLKNEFLGSGDTTDHPKDYRFLPNHFYVKETEF